MHRNHLLCANRISYGIPRKCTFYLRITYTSLRVGNYNLYAWDGIASAVAITQGIKHRVTQDITISTDALRGEEYIYLAACMHVICCTIYTA